MPLSRLVPRSQKSTLMFLSSVLVFLLAVLAFQFYFNSLTTSVHQINYTQLRSIGEASTAQSLSVEGELLTVAKSR